MDLWSIALEERAKADEERRIRLEQQGKQDGDTYMFFMGSSQCGKSTMLLRFLERGESPKSTIGIEYTFGRRSRGANMAKDITHLWELGGGTLLAKLIEIPITAECLKGLVVFIVLDLSKPEELWNTLEVLLKQLKQHLDNIVTQLKVKSPEAVAKLRQAAWKKFGDDHPDKDLLNPLLVPLVIFGGKYDLFQDFDPEKKKIICKTLRFIAHTNGAYLQFVSTKSDTLFNKTKQLLSHFAFGTPASRSMSMDHTKPLIVPAGADALGQIGVPPIPAGDISKISAKNPYDLWKQSYCGFFPPLTSNKSHIPDDPCKDVKYQEPAIDSMRAQKDEELEKYRKQCERKARELARQRAQSMAGSSTTSRDKDQQK
ncbi:cytoplasmic dynein 2 light intermediate chain 1-like isoform X2 [Dysidea avara]|uniref:cytoplasmic dynein 2 light intermediate chain 1-like isoform X2 n=1 Tax=Dysidea avara TaxID=196820 RepID=UPI00331824FB